MTVDLGPAGITEKVRFYVWPKSVFCWPKMRCIPKKHPKFAKRLIFILEKSTLLFSQFFPVMARTWLEPRSVCFFAYCLAQKSVFCHTTLNFVFGPLVPLGETVRFPPWNRFFDLSFTSYGLFRKKKLGQRVKKSSPSPLWGQCLPETAHRPRFARGLDTGQASNEADFLIFLPAKKHRNRCHPA